MPKTYEIAPKEVAERAEKLILKHYPDLDHSGVTIEFLYARNDRGSAVSHQGYPALAVVRVVGLKDRAKGSKDAEITIDALAYERMSPAQRDALLDHELNHLIVARDKFNDFKFDDLHRPKLVMRKHDYQMGWFTCIAQRHGLNSPEVYQAKLLWDNDGQAYFPMLADAAVEQIG